MVVDGFEGKEYDELCGGTLGLEPGEHRPTFGPGPELLAYTANRGKNWYMVVEGAARGPYDGVGPPEFSPDGFEIGYYASRDDEWFVVVGDEESNKFPAIGLGSFKPVFSPDGKRVGYGGWHGENEKAFFVVLDGMEGKQTRGGVGTPIFSPDSRHAAYVWRREKDKALVVLDGVSGREYDDAQDIVFSPDGKHVAYSAEKDGKWLAVVDGAEGSRYERIRPQLLAPTSQEYQELPRGPIAFSPVSQHVAYAASRAGKSVVVVNGVEGREYVSTGRPFFSPDGKHIAYIAASGKEIILVLDGMEMKDVLWCTRPMFDSPNSVHAIAERNGEFFLVQVEIVEE